MKYLFTVIAAMGLSFASSVYASGGHHDHNHEAAVETAPNGGTLRNAGSYKGELVLEGNLVKIFIYGEDVKPIAKSLMKDSIKGGVEFPTDKKMRPVEFKWKDDHYQASIAGINKVHRYDMHVKAIVNNKEITIDFGVDNIH
jgi:hypothetical protein